MGANECKSELEWERRGRGEGDVKAVREEPGEGEGEGGWKCFTRLRDHLSFLITAVLIAAADWQERNESRGVPLPLHIACSSLVLGWISVSTYITRNT